MRPALGANWHCFVYIFLALESCGLVLLTPLPNSLSCSRSVKTRHISRNREQPLLASHLWSYSQKQVASGEPELSAESDSSEGISNRLALAPKVGFQVILS